MGKQHLDSHGDLAENDFQLKMRKCAKFNLRIT